MSSDPVNGDHDQNARDGIGTLNENSLHAEIIAYLAQPGDILESELEGYRIDIHRGNQVIEVQTAHLGKLTRKVQALAESHQVEVVYPIHKLKYIHRVNAEGETVSRRRSPKQGKLAHAFDELVYAPDLIDHPNVSLTLMLIESEEIWQDDGQGSWRRKYWSIAERNLIKVHSQHRYQQPMDLLDLLPRSLPAPFTNRQLADLLKIPARLAGKITYTFRKMGLVTVAGKDGRANLFSID